jgi:hypothetical protein
MFFAFLVKSAVDLVAASWQPTSCLGCSLAWKPTSCRSFISLFFFGPVPLFVFSWELAPPPDREKTGLLLRQLRFDPSRGHL